MCRLYCNYCTEHPFGSLASVNVVRVGEDISRHLHVVELFTDSDNLAVLYSYG